MEQDIAFREPADDSPSRRECRRRRAETSGVMEYPLLGPLEVRDCLD
jgi:hypothetical protein